MIALCTGDICRKINGCHNLGKNPEKTLPNLEIEMKTRSLPTLTIQPPHAYAEIVPNRTRAHNNIDAVCCEQWATCVQPFPCHRSGVQGEDALHLTLFSY